jgi:hypothetical protein
MITDWILEENLLPFVTMASRVVGRVMDEDDREWLPAAVAAADAEANRWFELPLTPDGTQKLQLAPDPGSCVVHVRAEVSHSFGPQIEVLLQVFQEYKLEVG